MVDNVRTQRNSFARSSAPPPPFELGVVSKAKSRRSTGDSLRIKTKSTDFFGEGFHMRLDGESIELNSWGGAICSLLLIVILMAYAFQKIEILVHKEDQ